MLDNTGPRSLTSARFLCEDTKARNTKNKTNSVWRPQGLAGGPPVNAPVAVLNGFFAENIR